MNFNHFFILYEQQFPEGNSDSEASEQSHTPEYDRRFIQDSSAAIAQHIVSMTGISVDLHVRKRNNRQNLEQRAEGLRTAIQEKKNEVREYFLKSIVSGGYDVNHHFLYDLTHGICGGLTGDDGRPLSRDLEFYEAGLGFLGNRELSWTRGLAPGRVTEIIQTFGSFLNTGTSSSYGDNTKLWYTQLFFSALFEYEVSESECLQIIKNPEKFGTILNLANEKCQEEFTVVAQENDATRKASEQITVEKAEAARKIFRSSEHHDLVKIPLTPLQQVVEITDEQEKKMLLAKIAIVAGYGEDNFFDFDVFFKNLKPQEQQKIEAIATLMTTDINAPEGISLCTQSTNILLANDDARRLEGFWSNV